MKDIRTYYDKIGHLFPANATDEERARWKKEIYHEVMKLAPKGTDPTAEHFKAAVVMVLKDRRDMADDDLERWTEALAAYTRVPNQPPPDAATLAALGIAASDAGASLPWHKRAARKWPYLVTALVAGLIGWLIGSYVWGAGSSRDGDAGKYADCMSKLNKTGYDLADKETKLTACMASDCRPLYNKSVENEGEMLKFCTTKFDEAISRCTGNQPKQQSAAPQNTGGQRHAGGGGGGASRPNPLAGKLAEERAKNERLREQLAEERNRPSDRQPSGRKPPRKVHVVEDNDAPAGDVEIVPDDTTDN